MLEVLLGLFILILAVGFALLPLIAVVLFFIYIVAPNLLGFETKRNSSRQTVYSKARKNAYQQVKTTPKNTAKPKPAPKKPAEPAKPRAEIVLQEFEKLTSALQECKLKEKCVEMQGKLEKLHTMENEDQNVRQQMEKMYTTYLPSFLNVLSRYERLQYANQSETLSEYEEKVLHTAEVIDDALENILSTVNLQNMDALEKDMSELELALKSDGMAGQLKLPK